MATGAEGVAKSPDAFRTISEVAAQLETPAHVLRFWESKFAQIKPVKRAGGRRYYRPDDIALVAGIKVLLHEQGMTIRGVQKLLRERGARHVATLSALPWEGVDAEEQAGEQAGEPAGEDTPEPEAAEEGEAAEDAGASPDPVVVGPWPGAGAEEAEEHRAEVAALSDRPPCPAEFEAAGSRTAPRPGALRGPGRTGPGASVSRLREALAEADRARLGAGAGRLRPLVHRLRALRDGSPGPSP